MNVDAIAPAISPLARPWKTLQLGVYREPRNIMDALEEKNIIVSACARTLIHHRAFRIESQPRTVELVLVTPRQLGISSGTPIEAIHRRGRQSDLSLCSPEIGPLLRLAYLDQPQLQPLRIAMRAIEDAQTEECFALGHDERGLSLECAVGSARYFIYSPDARFVFVR